MDKFAPIEQRLRALLRPPPKLTVSEWAEAERRLSRESSPEPYAYSARRAEYQRGIMDAFSDPANRRVVVCSSAQVGKTTIVENIVGFHIAQDPSPIMLVLPTLEMAETMSKDRLTPMFRDTPALVGKIADARMRDSGNTLLHKNFAGGHVTMAGANSAASLASRPIRILLFDEIDRFPPSAGTEGPPIKIATKRTNNFFNRRIGLFSTPTDEDVGIDAEYKASDQRRFFCPCPACGHSQILRWKQVLWTDERGTDARYACEDCGTLLNEAQRDAMVVAGKWIATAPFHGVAGFHVNELYSPWRSFAQVVAEFLEAKDDHESLKVWTNTSLGEAWKDETAGVSAAALEDEPGLPIGHFPPWAVVATLGVDTQGDRLALQLLGWGEGGKQATIDYLELPGDPHLDEAWDKLTEYREQKWPHPLGGEIGIRMTAIDSGGHHTQKVVAYARKHKSDGVIAVKGASTPLSVMLRTRPTKVDYKANGKLYKKSGDVWLVGTETTKGAIVSKLRAESDKRKIFFAEGLGSEFFNQLTSENYDKRTRKWVNPKKKRNEALDTMVYGTAVTMHPDLRLDVASRAKWAKFAARLTVADPDAVSPGEQSSPVATSPASTAPVITPPAKRSAPIARRSGGFVMGWKS